MILALRMIGREQQWKPSLVRAPTRMEGYCELNWVDWVGQVAF